MSERALIQALRTRYQDPQPTDRAALDAAYADAMRRVAQQFPDDADVQALFAEAMMDLLPWDLYDVRGKPRPATPEMIATLERTLAKAPLHPLALHLYIHAVEAGPTPEKASAAADTIRTLIPGIGHLVHMASHIDVRLGQWARAIETNANAMAADASYEAQSWSLGSLPSMPRITQRSWTVLW